MTNQRVFTFTETKELKQAAAQLSDLNPCY